MLKLGIIVALLASTVGGEAGAAGKKPPPPPPQSEADDRDSDDRPPRGPAAAPPASRGYSPPAYASQPAPPGRYVVLTEKQKRCGVQNRCELDSRTPCPPCW